MKSTAKAKKARREIHGVLVKVSRAGKAMMSLCMNARDRDTKRRACAIGRGLWRIRGQVQTAVDIASLLK